jgi:hypothetical protein
LRQIVRCEDAAHTGNARSFIAMDRDNARVRAGQRHQLDVQRVVQPDVGSVLLRPRHALDGPEPGDGAADDGHGLSVSVVLNLS